MTTEFNLKFQHDPDKYRLEVFQAVSARCYARFLPRFPQKLLRTRRHRAIGSVRTCRDLARRSACTRTPGRFALTLALDRRAARTLARRTARAAASRCPMGGAAALVDRRPLRSERKDTVRVRGEQQWPVLAREARALDTVDAARRWRLCRWRAREAGGPVPRAPAAHSQATLMPLSRARLRPGRQRQRLRSRARSHTSTKLVARCTTTSSR